MTVAIITHPDCTLHRNAPLHPEAPERVDTILDALIAQRLDPLLRHEYAREASRAELELGHRADYLDRLQQAEPDHGIQPVDADTGLTRGSLRAARLAAGAVQQAVEGVLGGRYQRAFCAIRPPGHHAGPASSAGFCLYSNVALGALKARQLGVSRVAIVDFDVHHGDGTEAVIGGREGIALWSVFQSPFYPFSGEVTPFANVHNLPLPAGSGGTAWREAVRPWLAQIRDFAPELLLVSAGFDGHTEDEMSGWRLSDDDYAWISAELVALAETCCAGRLVSVLEGGYELPALARAAARHVAALLAH